MVRAKEMERKLRTTKRISCSGRSSEDGKRREHSVLKHRLFHGAGINWCGATAVQLDDGDVN